MIAGCSVCYGSGITLDGKACPFAPHEFADTSSLIQRNPAPDAAPSLGVEIVKTLQLQTPRLTQGIDRAEAERLARVALRECPYPGHNHPNDWSDAAMAVCRWLVSASPVSAPHPKEK